MLVLRSRTAISCRSLLKRTVLEQSRGLVAAYNRLPRSVMWCDVRGRRLSWDCVMSTVCVLVFERAHLDITYPVAWGWHIAAWQHNWQLAWLTCYVCSALLSLHGLTAAKTLNQSGKKKLLKVAPRKVEQPGNMFHLWSRCELAQILCCCVARSTRSWGCTAGCLYLMSQVEE